MLHRRGGGVVCLPGIFHNLLEYFVNVFHMLLAAYYIGSWIHLLVLLFSC